MRLLSWWPSVGALAIGMQTPSGQEARLIATGPPLAELTHEFMSIEQVFELNNGMVVLLDKLEGRVRLVDFRTDRSRPIGALGNGPGEYREPNRLIGLGGDSVGIVDNGNSRILALTPAGEVAGITPSSNNLSFRNPTTIATADGRGWFYGEQPVTVRESPTPRLTDSVAILRWNAGKAAEFVTTFFRRPPPGAAIGPAGEISYRSGALAELSPQTLWTVDSDGRIAVVYGAPYRVDLVFPNRERRQGRSIAYPRLPISDAIKDAYLRERMRPQVTYVVDRRNNSLVATRTRPPAVVISNWASELPAFRGDAFVAFAPDGKLWVQRSTFDREGARYDIIGADGELLSRVRLPEGSRVVGFGHSSLLVVRRDSNDIEYLQRHTLPQP